MKVGVFVQCFNEMSVLPWFIRFYNTMLPGATIVVMDNESTDGTGEFAKAHGCQVHTFSTKNKLDDAGRPALKETARVLMPGMDWIINVDTDEFLIVGLQQLEKELRAGTTQLVTRGVSMCGDSKTEDLQDLDVFAIAKGFEDSSYNKPCCYNPTRILSMNYSPGCHSARPKGTVVKSATVYDLYHFHYLGETFLMHRYNIFYSRNNAKGIYGTQYTSDALAAARAYRVHVGKSKPRPSVAERMQELGVAVASTSDSAASASASTSDSAASASVSVSVSASVSDSAASVSASVSDSDFAASASASASVSRSKTVASRVHGLHD